MLVVPDRFVIRSPRFFSGNRRGPWRHSLGESGRQTRNGRCQTDRSGRDVSLQVAFGRPYLVRVLGADIRMSDVGFADASSSEPFPSMQTIDESRLESDPQYRYAYVAGFIGFGPEDAALIQGAAPYLGPIIGELVEKTYAKLMGYDATARHFLPRQAGYEGPIPASLAELSASHPQLQFRKEHLTRYFLQLISRSYDAKMVLYLDMVGKIHTPSAGNSEIHVPLVQMNALMGLLSDILLEAVAQFPLDPQTAFRTQRAFQKLLWIQNDFITRHYARRSEDAT